MTDVNLGQNQTVMPNNMANAAVDQSVKVQPRSKSSYESQNQNIHHQVQHPNPSASNKRKSSGVINKSQAMN